MLSQFDGLAWCCTN